MSINNIGDSIVNDQKFYSGGSKYFNENTGTYEDYDQKDSYYVDPNNQVLPGRFNNIYPVSADNAFKEEYYVPIDSVKQQVNQALHVIFNVVGKIDEVMQNVYISFVLNPNIEEAHKALWKEIIKNSKLTSEQIADYDQNEDIKNNHFDPVNNTWSKPERMYPRYISYDEYLYCLNSKSTVANRLLREYKKVTSHSVFSYLLEIRSLLKAIENEGYNIKNILQTVFKEDYEDDSQKQIGVQFDAWAKVAIHNAQRFAQTILSQPGAIPDAEVDKITEKQAVEFQAFFAIRLDAVNKEISSLLDSILKDLMEQSDIFYERYLYQSLKFKKEIVSPMELDFYTTSLKNEAPMLVSELLVATNVINANFGMIMTDLIQKNQITASKIDNMYNNLNEKRKYSNYIFQLSSKGTSKQKVLVTVTNDPYSQIFKSSEYAIKNESDLKSNHGSLDDLLEDHHPQYLLRDGGTITGDIVVLNNARIDGVHISSHSHNGIDGTEKILSTDIDYDSVRTLSVSPAVEPYSVTIDSFISEVTNSGVPVVDVVLSIDTGDVDGTLEYEILIAEV